MRSTGIVDGLERAAIVFGAITAGFLVVKTACETAEAVISLLQNFEIEDPEEESDDKKQLDPLA
jgi:hypothetical protein